MCSIYHIFIPISHDMFVLFPLNHHSEWLNSNHRLDCNITEWTSFGPIIINHRVSYQFPLNHHFLKLQSPFWMLKSLKSEKNMLVSPFSHVFPMFFHVFPIFHHGIPMDATASPGLWHRLHPGTGHRRGGRPVLRSPAAGRDGPGHAPWRTGKNM